MDLQGLWEKYREETVFNYSVLPEHLKKHGEHLVVEPQTLIVSRGEFPGSIYFILDGVAAGVREYADGNEYSYFQLDRQNGNIGLLEIFARKESYIATIVSITRVEMVRIDAALIYEAAMQDVSLLRRCTALLADDLYKRSGNDGILYYFQGIDRVRYYLTSYYERHQAEAEKGKVTVHAEYQDIASSIGVSVRTVGRNLQKLKETGEIGSWHKKTTVSQEQYRQMLENLYL
ncbi:Crp/Fnr family transcriptional regulator [Mordavella massiliensis]|uniref:Crp/Fnr family transcriptional regulator n=1 Tax=Mordavella massiliensis TaxID=1871024 RepID=A0A938XEF3_9CLOT|nr:Crp/Fnr family transcriptional regulator [Mordavella massiliensis]MBM6949228.1 Crp/Fnr family transcriptional regulator [Mordavella massiliensis]